MERPAMEQSTRGGALPPPALTAFVQRLEADPALAERLAACPSPQAILAIATEQGLSLELRELRTWSRELSAACWPWHGRGSAWRRRFFNGPAGDA